MTEKLTLKSILPVIGCETVEVRWYDGTLLMTSVVRGGITNVENNNHEAAKERPDNMTGTLLSCIQATTDEELVSIAEAVRAELNARHIQEGNENDDGED